MSRVLVSDMGDPSCCETCGSTAIMRPRELHAVNEVTCARCGSLAGTSPPITCFHVFETGGIPQKNRLLM